MKEHYFYLLNKLLKRQVVLLNNQVILKAQSTLLYSANLDLLKNGEHSTSTKGIAEIKTRSEKIGIDFMTNHYCSSFLLSYSMFEASLFELFYDHHLGSKHLMKDSIYTTSAISIFENDLEFHQKQWAESCARNIVQSDNNKMFRKISTFFGFKLDKIEKDKNFFSEIRARRNIALHRSWIADHSYCSNYPSYGFVSGQPIYADYDYLNHAEGVIDRIFEWLLEEFESKIK